MKKSYLRRFSLLLCILICALGLTACSDTISSAKAKEAAKERRAVNSADELKSWAADIINFLDGTSDEQIKIYAENSDTLDSINKKSYIVNPDGMGTATVEFYNGWVKTRQDLGALKSIDKIDVQVSGETGTLCTIAVDTTYEKRTCKFELVIDDDYNLSSGAINPTYTVGEKMEKAVMNTLIGMGTVFIVLIFISFIISMLKYVNRIGKKEEKPAKDEPTGVDNAIAQIVTSEENEADDLELVAAITAAIAAYEGTSSDGLVVRSIRKVRSNSRR